MTPVMAAIRILRLAENGSSPGGPDHSCSLFRLLALSLSSPSLFSTFAATLCPSRFIASSLIHTSRYRVCYYDITGFGDRLEAFVLNKPIPALSPAAVEASLVATSSFSILLTDIRGDTDIQCERCSPKLYSKARWMFTQWTS